MDKIRIKEVSIMAKKIRISILVDEDDWRKFKSKSKEEGLTASTVLRLLIKSYLGEEIKLGLKA